MDSFEMLRTLFCRTWKEEIPVVLITSENSDNALLKGYELGVSDIINKPFNPNIVKRRVGSTIELYLLAPSRGARPATGEPLRGRRWKLARSTSSLSIP